MRWRDRVEAGEQLANALEKYKGEPAVVYALPRGGVVLGAIVARRLGVELDLTIPRKVGHPPSRELAVCAVSEGGYHLCNELLSTVDQDWLEAAIAREIAEAKRRREVYLGNRPLAAVAHKTAIIVDDGIATGLTMRVAIHDIKERQPQKVVVAVPVAPADAAEQLRAEIDEFVALTIISAGHFGAVGAYYENFDQVSDEEVVQLLQSATLPTGTYGSR